MSDISVAKSPVRSQEPIMKWKPVRLEANIKWREPNFFEKVWDGPWYYKFAYLATPLVLLTGCSGNDGNGNNGGNNNVMDATTDASPMGDAGDGSVGDADAEVISPYCLPNDQRPGIVDNKQRLVVDTYDCRPKDIDFNDENDKFYLVCSFPNNRLLTYNPTDNTLTQLGQVQMTSQGPNGHVGDVHPSSIYLFNSMMSVPFQTQNTQYPTDVFGGVYLHDLASGLRMDTMDLAFMIMCGGCPQENFYLIHGPTDSVFSSGRLYVGNENFNPETNDYVRSIIPGYAFEALGQLTVFDDAEQPALAIPAGYRAANLTWVDGNTVAVAVAGIGAVGEPAKIVIYDTSSPQTVPVPVTDEIDLNLSAGWELVVQPELTALRGTNGVAQYAVVAATDGTNTKLIVVNLDTGAPQATQELDITQWVKGPVVGLIADGTNRVYVVEQGDSSAPYPQNNTGSVLVIDVDEATGASTVHDVDQNGPAIPVGVDPLSAELDPLTGKVYVAARRRSDCEGVEASDTDPYLQEVDPDAYEAGQSQ